MIDSQGQGGLGFQPASDASHWMGTQPARANSPHTSQQLQSRILFCLQIKKFQKVS